jgi:hypothetical protein
MAAPCCTCVMCAFVSLQCKYPGGSLTTSSRAVHSLGASTLRRAATSSSCRQSGCGHLAAQRSQQTVTAPKLSSWRAIIVS